MDRDRAIKVVKVIDALIELTAVSKILNTFYVAFHKYTIPKADGAYYLHGSQKLGGTISGRLSSSDPNMANLPSSGTQYAKPVKQCFRAAPGWLMVGADYNALETVTNALITKDPNKLRVLTDGFDGHCYHAYAYWPYKMPDIQTQMHNADTAQKFYKLISDDGTVTYHTEIDPIVQEIHIEITETEYRVGVINSIKTRYPDLRQKSKPVTFALQYGGSEHTLVTNTGMPPDEAKDVVARFKKLYEVAETYTADKLRQASHDGYVTCAFGLRVRTPILAKTILGQYNTPGAASAEGRSAGNALFQSTGMLNNRSANAFMQKVWDSPYRLDILPVNLIHDATYFLIRNDIEVLMFVNEHLVKAMQWQELPELQHDTVKLGGELSIFYPSWADEIVIPNNATREEILSICSAA